MKASPPWTKRSRSGARATIGVWPCPACPIFSDQIPDKHSEESRKHLPDAAAAYNLLARLWRGHGDIRKAAEAFTEAHRLNPFTFDAFQGLCDIGGNVNLSNSFRMTQGMATCAGSTIHNDDPPILARQPTVQPPNGNHNVLTPSNDPFNGNAKPSSDWNFKSRARSIFGSPPKTTKASTWDTPTAHGNPSAEDIEMGGMSNDLTKSPAPGLPPPMRRLKTFSKLGIDMDKESRLQPPQLKTSKLKQEPVYPEDTTSIGRPNGHKRTHSGHASNAASDTSGSAPRRSNRLFHQVTGSKSSLRLQAQQTEGNPVTQPSRDGEYLRKAKATGTKGRGLSTVGRVVSGNRKVMPPGPGDKESRAPSRNSVMAPAMPVASQKQPLDSTISVDTAVVEYLLELMRKFGAAHYALSRYDTKSAIEELQSLPIAHQESPWALAQVAKAYYWAADYTSSEAAFVRMLKSQPSRLQDVEIYSTVLWHLKKQVKLSFLAHTLKDLAYEAPQTWCAIGNAFALAKEHDQAKACFKRATQIDPDFWYAWTLLGHQYHESAEYETAMHAFRKGMGRERRNYDCWYGLGKCYELLGKFDEAVRHYRVAASINPGNNLLFLCIGSVSCIAPTTILVLTYQALEKSGHTRDALTQYTHALSLEPKSQLARFKKASVLRKLGLYEQAVEELETLKEDIPEEAVLFYHLGLCYKALYDKGAAVRNFTTALSLEPDVSYTRSSRVMCEC